MSERNSYSKTDNDATFMRMKEDHMKNGQLKPAYNIQFGVDSEYIVLVSSGHQPTDTITLIPFLKSIQFHTKFKYPKIVDDSGYESDENYTFLEKYKINKIFLKQNSKRENTNIFLFCTVYIKNKNIFILKIINLHK